MRINKRGQVWIETVLYTLIGLALIGVVLAFMVPKINQSKDKLMIEQAIASLNDIDVKINEVLKAPGNIRRVEFTMKKGSFKVDFTTQELIYTLEDMNKPYTEPGIEITSGKIKILTMQGPKTSTTTLTLTYAGRLDLRWGADAKDEEKTLGASTVPYQLYITNEGQDSTTGVLIVSISEVAGR